MAEAQIVHQVEQEAAANDKPEPWIAAEAVKLTNRAAGHQPPKHLAVQTGWIASRSSSRTSLYSIAPWVFLPGLRRQFLQHDRRPAIRSIELGLL